MSGILASKVAGMFGFYMGLDETVCEDLGL